MSDTKKTKLSESDQEAADLLTQAVRGKESGLTGAFGLALSAGTQFSDAATHGREAAFDIALDMLEYEMKDNKLGLLFAQAAMSVIVPESEQYQRAQILLLKEIDKSGNFEERIDGLLTLAWHSNNNDLIRSVTGKWMQHLLSWRKNGKIEDVLHNAERVMFNPLSKGLLWKTSKTIWEDTLLSIKQYVSPEKALHNLQMTAARLDNTELDGEKAEELKKLVSGIALFFADTMSGQQTYSALLAATKYDGKDPDVHRALADALWRQADNTEYDDEQLDYLVKRVLYHGRMAAGNDEPSSPSPEL